MANIGIKPFASLEITPQLMSSDRVCPIVQKERTDGSKVYIAYIIGTVGPIGYYTDLVDVLKRARPEDDVIIKIDSPGGYLVTGAMIASAINSSRARVFTDAKGFCASAAALIHSSAKRENIRCSDFAVMMYHTSSGGVMGFSTKVANDAENMVRYVNSSLLSQALEHGHITKEEFHRIQAGDEIFIHGAEFKRRNSGAAAQEINADTTGELQSATESMAIMAHRDSEWFGKNPTEEILDTMGPNPNMREPLGHYIYTSDNVNYRMYFQPAMIWSPREIRNVCKFLDSLTSDNTVTIYLGGDGDDNSSYLAGAVLDSVRECEALVTAVCAGLCSSVETMIYCYAHKREFDRYGSLRFEINRTFTNARPAWKAYYQQFLDRGMELGLLTQQDVDFIMTTGATKMLLKEDVDKVED